MKRVANYLVSALASLAILVVMPAAHSTKPVSAQVALGCGIDASRMAPEGEEQAFSAGVNAYRAQNGLQPFQLSWALTVSAVWKSTNLAANHDGMLAHDDPGGRSWMQRFTDCGYNPPGSFVGENLAAGNATALATLSQWEASPPHNANMLNPQYTVIGVKRIQSTDQLGWYWTLEFGSALDHDLLDGLAGR